MFFHLFRAELFHLHVEYRVEPIAEDARRPHTLTPSTPTPTTAAAAAPAPTTFVCQCAVQPPPRVTVQLLPLLAAPTAGMALALRWRVTSPSGERLPYEVVSSSQEWLFSGRQAGWVHPAAGGDAADDDKATTAM